MQGQEWLVLAYTLPPEPSRKRVSVWRHLKRLGAVYTEEGLWFLPMTDRLEAALRAVVAEVEHHGGSATAFAARDLSSGQAERLTSRFNKARDDEYLEVRRLCQKFLDHIQRATDADELDFAEVEELEQDLEKRVRWLAQVRERDAFGSPEHQPVERMLEECKNALARFTEQAYERAK